MSRCASVIAVILWLAAGVASAVEQVIPLPATLNGESVGELNASVEDNQLRALDVAPLLNRLRDDLAPEYFQHIPTNQAGPVPVAILESAGLKTHFDFANLSVALSFPPDLRRPQIVNLVGSPAVTAVRTVPTADFSAYMNVLGGVDYIASAPEAQSGFDQPQLAVENAFNLHRFVLQNETDLNPTPDQTWAKRDTRLSYDLPADRLRLTAGDLDYPVIGFQGFVPMIGFSVNRQDSLQPFRVTSPLGQSAFFLQSDSKVDVIINGHVVQTMQLAAGPHQISNFPLTGGANTVILRITDPVGRVEYINARLFYDPALLRAGESEFNYAVGFPSTTDPQSPFYYYRSEPLASTYYRLGLTDQTTAGVNAQATTDTQLGGAEVVYSTRVGTFDLDAAGSHDRTLGAGAAQRLQYHYYVPHDSPLADGQVTLVAQNESGHYAAPSPFATPSVHASSWNYQAQYSQRLGERWFAGVGYSQQFNGDDTHLATSSLIGGYHYGRIYADATLDHNSGTASHTEWTAFFSLRIELERSQNLFTTFDTSSHTSRSEWQYTPADNVESVSSTLGVQTTPSQEDYYGNLNYTGRRAQLSLSQDALTGGEDRTSLRWGTALVYADGVFGVSQPVQDSFAIIESTGSLQADGGVGVQPQAQRYQAQEDWLGPAVMPQLVGYYPTRMVAEPRQSEADFDPQEGDLLLNPTDHSGTLVRLGHPATIAATLQLRWANGLPASCVDGNLVSASGVSSEFVSNRDGMVYLDGLAPGQYHATISGYPDAAFSVTIPASSARQLDLGQIQLTVQP
jgi:outer membrane usher protein